MAQVSKKWKGNGGSELTKNRETWSAKITVLGVSYTVNSGTGPMLAEDGQHGL